MKHKEFWFSVLASVIAAAILEAAGLTSWFAELRKPVTVPRWSVLALAIAPIFLAVLWFQRYVSPEHKKTLEELEQVRTELDASTKSAADLRRQVTVLQDTASQSAEREAALTESLERWKSRGVVIYSDDSEIEEVAGRRFGPEVVDVDNKRFVHCVFEGSILRYKGIGPVQFQSDTFGDIRWVFDGPVANAFWLLRAMYQSGVPELARQLDLFLQSLRTEEPQQNRGAPGAR
jgi:hypothetical protein